MSTTTLPVIHLQSCPKGYTRDLDKTISPQETYERVQARMQAAGLDILAEVRRVDVGRLGIPVYLSVCGRDARGIMPTRKQMGKGSSPEQARASALMELMERFAFFSFWQRLPHMVSATWAEAEERFGKDLLPIEEICRSVDDSLSPEQAREAMSTLRWNFFPATHLADGRTVWLPLDWFKLLGEFNGTSAGNSPEESLLQGLSELVERHVCCRIDRERLTTPTIDPHEVDDPTLRDLLAAFEREGIHIVLKDFSLGMPLPTVGAVAWDPATFPARSEIVFTAGTAASPAKAAIRAVTEIAQLGGDFCTQACYEASGLSKFERLEDIQWLLKGPVCRCPTCPAWKRPTSATSCSGRCMIWNRYRSMLWRPRIPIWGVPAHYCIAPGLSFRERDRNQSIGLFVGRKLAEEAERGNGPAWAGRAGALLPQRAFPALFPGHAGPACGTF